MVGCWFAGQGKKGDCVGKKVNGGPVVPEVLILLLISGSNRDVYKLLVHRKRYLHTFTYK